MFVHRRCCGNLGLGAGEEVLGKTFWVVVVVEGSDRCCVLAGEKMVVVSFVTSPDEG